MIRGTNPKIKIYTNIDSSMIDDVVITLKQLGNKLEKRKEDCTFEDGTIITQLTQEETLSLKAGYAVEIQAKVKFVDKTVAMNIIKREQVNDDLHNKVI